MKRLCHRLIREEKGQDLIEYALLCGFMSLVVILALTTLETELEVLYDDMTANVQDAAS